MKKLLILLLLVFALPVHAEEAKFKAEQIRSSTGKYCNRCDYVLRDGWITQVTDSGQEWKLKPKESLYVLPFGQRPNKRLTQIYRVSPTYGNKNAKVLPDEIIRAQTPAVFSPTKSIETPASTIQPTDALLFQN